MDTVLVGASLRLAAGMGFSGSGLETFPIGAVLVDMNFGGSSVLGAAGLWFMRMDGGATDLGAEAGAAEDAPLPDGTSGLSLMVFLAAEEADAALGETGTLFRAAVSVLRIVTGSFTPPGALLSVSAMIKILFRKTKNYFITMVNIAYKPERANKKKKKTDLFLKKVGVLQKKWKKILIFCSVAGKLP